jgi:DNA-directed RNA polymerase specialized sigma24 family protein
VQFRTMRRSTALGLLPPAHARILDLVDQGVTGNELADRLGLDASAVAPLLSVARAKLRALELLDEPSACNEADN